MKICPKCKNEYRDDIIRCADCDCQLVDANTEKLKLRQLAEVPYPVAGKAKEYLEYCKFADITVDDPDEEGMVRIFCREKDYKEAVKQVQVLLYEEAKQAMEEKVSQMSDEELEEMKEENQRQVFSPSNIYQNYEVKAAENKTSAYCFLVLGALGVVMVILSWFGKLPFSIGGSGNWFTHGVMLIVFIIFFFVGIISAKSVGKYKALADKEADTQSELVAYLEEAFTVTVLSEIEADTEEEAYFKRMNFMRSQVMDKYAQAELDMSFVESLLDEHYDKLFG